jgi:hypothetical protein
MYGGDEKLAQSFGGKLEATNIYLRDQEINGRIILKCI